VKQFTVQFLYKGIPSYKGNLILDADTERVARALVSIMVETEDPRLPDNWDEIQFSETGR